MERECGDILTRLQPEPGSILAPSRRDVPSTFTPLYPHGGPRYVKRLV
jgi:hypothetical protein